MLAVPLLLAGLLALGGGSAAAGDPPERYRFTGHGTDHGVGFSQRGAAGRAKAGQTYDQILLHYFDSARTEIDTVAEDTTIRALVVRSARARATATSLVQGGQLKRGVEILEKSYWTFDTPGVDGRVFPNSWHLVLVGRGTRGAWRLEVRDPRGATRHRYRDADARLTVTPVQNGEGPAVTRVLIRPKGTRYDTYAGVLRIGRVDGRIRVVDHVPIESFVRSVVPSEMGPANHPEALKAQAVASRSYFLAGLGDGTAFLAYDVEASGEKQSYKGVEKEHPRISAAVDATAFQVLRYIDTRRDRKVIIRAFYHAAGGGGTEASMNVFTGETGTPGTRVPYLMGGPDVDEEGRPYDARSPMYEWHTRGFTLAQLSRILAQDRRTDVGRLTQWPIGSERTFLARRQASLLADTRDATPAPVNRGASGRLTWLVLRGTRNGRKVEKRVAGWLFKQVFNAHRGYGEPLGSTMIFRERVP
jgi:SpoIID/LytB domain protein